ncbi:MAG TPA: protoporphyrinogen oxidase [Chloroflexi bacterium]|nr:protoporphyrinogen oxidase [Chloroflexota bacterium]
MNPLAADREKAGGAERTSATLRVAIVGGGITGLSVAWYLEREAAASGVALRYTILERSPRWGGKIRTERIAGFGDEPFVIEAGPDSFLTQKPWALRLVREIGLADRILNTNDHLRRVFVLRRGKPVPLPDGVLLIVPTRILPFVLSPLLSPPAKLRMGLELFIPPRRDGEDETVADFVRRRLGAEALDRLAEPLMSGIYNAEAERQSLLATFPRFRALEEQFGSLIRGMLISRRAHRRRRSAASDGKTSAMFVSLRAGMYELVEALTDRLSGDLRLNAGVERIVRRRGGRYELLLDGEERLEADAVIITTPACAAADLLQDVAPLAVEGLRAIRYVSTGTISLAFRADEINHPLDGFGLVIPRSEGRRVNAITWTSTKFDHRAPEGYVLLRVFFGGSRRPEMMEKDDDELLSIVRSELSELMGLDTRPILHRIYRWRRANPQYDVGHLERVGAIEAALPSGVYVTGSAYRGVGLPDCVYQAQQTARRVLETIRPQAPAPIQVSTQDGG